MVRLSCSGSGGGIYAKLASGMARYNCARASPTRNSSVLRSLARRQQAQYRQVTHRPSSGRVTHRSEKDRHRKASRVAAHLRLSSLKRIASYGLRPQIITDDFTSVGSFGARTVDHTLITP